MKTSPFCKHMKSVSLLYVLAGAVHLVPQLYNWLTDLTGGTPWIQMVVGLVVVIFGLMGLLGKSCGCDDSMCGSCGSKDCKCE